jgi:predicted Rossmann-fold nucleotide-binding protein
MPGGFGTLDEMFELLTLAQTHKLRKQITVLIYGTSYWRDVFNLDVLIDKGAISPRDRGLFTFVDSPEVAFDLLKTSLTENHLRRARPHQGEDGGQDGQGGEAESSSGPDFARTSK